MTATMPRLLIVAFVAGSYTLGGATFSNQRVTTQTPPAGDCTSLPPAVTSFLTTQGSVYLFFDATVTTSDSLNNDWLAPDGTVVAGTGWGPVSGEYCFDNAPSLAISNLPTSQIGAWHARVWDNGSLLFSAPFTVSAPPAWQVTVLDEDTSTSPGLANNACTAPPLVTTFTPASPSVYLYFDVTGAVVGDSAMANFYAPDGALYTSAKWGPISSTGPSGYICFTDSIAISGALAASEPGVWSISVLWDSFTTPLFTLNFTIAAVSAPVISPGGVVNGASFSAGPVVPGSIVSIFGTDLASGTAQAPTNSPPTTLQSTQVLMNGIAAPLFYVSATQINAEVPWEVNGLFVTDLTVQVVSNGAQSNVVTTPLAATAPGIFAVVHNADNTLVTSAKPAVPGEYLVAYCTGLGTVTNQPPTGTAAPMSPLSYTAQSSTVTIGGLSAYVPFSGLAPGFTGLYQVDAQVPASVASASAAPLVLSIGGASTTVAIAVQSGGLRQFTLTTTTAGSGVGSISANPPGPSYPAGTVVTLTATPNAGSTFAGWSGACSGTASCTVSMNSNQAVTAAFNLTSSSYVSLTSLSTTTADPFDLLTVNGTGFDPANAAISVLLIPPSGGPATAVPAVAATASTVQISVPPFFNATQGLTAGTVNVQVVQLEGTTVSTSNVLSGLSINALQAPSGPALGALTATTLQASLNISTTTQRLAAGNASLTNLATALADYNNDLLPVVTAVNAIMNDPSLSVSLPTANGVPFTLDANVLQLTDQLMWAYVSQYVNLIVNPIASQPAADAGSSDRVAPAAANDCNLLVGSDNGFATQFACGYQAFNETYPPASAAAYQLGAKVYVGANLSLLGGFAIDGFAGAGAIGPIGPFSTEQVTNALELTWDQASSLFASWATSLNASQSFSQILGDPKSWENLPLQVIDKFALGNWGILGSTKDIVDVVTEASAIIAPASGSDLDEGWIVSGPPAGAPSGATAIEAFLSLNGAITVTSLAAPGSQQVTNSSAITIAAPTSFTLTVNVSSTGAAGGTVSSFPTSISCPPNCTASFPTETAVTLMTAPNPGSTFAAWSGACSGTGMTCTVTMSSNRAVTATFNSTAQQFTLTVVKAGTGSGTVAANPSGLSYPAGTNVTLTATPDSQSIFAGWGSASGKCTGTSTTCSFKVTADDIITATFNIPVLTVNQSGTGSGTVVPSPVGTQCGTGCWNYLPYAVVTLTANPATGSTFAGWSGACSGTGTCTVTMSTDQAVTATFNLATSQSVTPATAFLGSLNTCAATTQQLSKVFQVTAPAGVAWNAGIYGNPNEAGYGITSVSPSSGSGSGAFTVIVEALPMGTTNCLPSSTPMSGSVVVYFPPTGNPAVDEVFVTVTWNDVT
jgi:uncharacterized protein (TIGR03437 family)